ncbi:zinc-ribbon domain-containing protein [Priestia sp. YIM B13551]|uniref:zinc-ribbon domain-containing protein n=1 Tax=Priestia sp. YIM B13551 TaxID=3366306 RepID=UPI00366DF3F6
MAKKITLAEARPDLAKEWHPTKNGDLKPTDVTKSAPKKVWWKCSEEHEWPAYINNRNKKDRNDGCPFCSGRYATPETSLAYLEPEVAKEWDYEKNTLTPELVKPGTNKKVWWICSIDNRHKWDAVINSRTGENGNGCPYCGGRKAWEENNLLVHNPLLASEWNYELNKVNPEEVLPYSNKKYWWTCSECGEVWDQALNNRQRYGARGCKKCTSGQQTSFPEQAIFYYAKKLFPTLTIKNNTPIHFDEYEMTGDVYFPEKNVLIEYDGEYAHKMNPERDKRKNRLCIEKGIQLIRIVEPNVSVFEDNLTIYIKREESSGFKSLKKAMIQLFQLLIQRFSFNASARELEDLLDLENDFIDIEETIKRIRKENSIVSTHPEICKDWDYEKNKGLKPDFFSHGSSTTVWWICEKNHSYSMKIHYRTRGSKCSYCAKRKLSPEDSLMSKFPLVAKEWHPTMNGDLTPDKIFAGSTQKVWWQCSKNQEHVWDTTPNHRTSGPRPTGCPGCSGKKVFLSNSLAVVNPELAKEWHPTKNDELTPYEVTAGSDKKVWWLCNLCQNEWEAHIYHRNNGTGCPSECKNKLISKGLKAFYSKGDS